MRMIIGPVLAPKAEGLAIVMHWLSRRFGAKWPLAWAASGVIGAALLASAMLARTGLPLGWGQWVVICLLTGMLMITGPLGLIAGLVISGLFWLA